MVPAILTFLAEQVGAKKNIGQFILQHVPTFSLFWPQHFFFGRSNENAFKMDELHTTRNQFTEEQFGPWILMIL